MERELLLQQGKIGRRWLGEVEPDEVLFVAQQLADLAGIVERTRRVLAGEDQAA
jgi:hypothetical protein